MQSERFWSSGGRRKRRSPSSTGKLSDSTAAAGSGHGSSSHEGVTGIAEAAPADNDSEGEQTLCCTLNLLSCLLLFQQRHFTETKTRQGSSDCGPDKDQALCWLPQMQ